MNKFKTIDEKLKDEVIHGNNSYLLSQKEFNEKIVEKQNKFLVPKNEMKIIISHCIYNEDQFFQGCLFDDLKINDLDAIHILDGAWGEQPNGNYQSTDKTLEIITDFIARAKEIGIEVIYDKHPKNQIWESEPIKRNYQLNRIRELFGNNLYYNILKDGDEFFHHLSGRQNTWLKKDFIEWIKFPNNIGLMVTNAYYSDNIGYSDLQMSTPRFLPSTKKLHYYTGKSMMFCDEFHNIVSDFNPRVKQPGSPSLFFNYTSMMIINKFTIRNHQRQKDKKPFVDFIEAQKGNIPCTFSKFF